MFGACLKHENTSGTSFEIILLSGRVLGWLAAVPPISWLLELAYRAFLPLRPRLQRWLRNRWQEPVP